MSGMESEQQEGLTSEVEPVTQTSLTVEPVTQTSITVQPVTAQFNNKSRIGGFRMHERILKFPSTLQVELISIKQIRSENNPPPVSSNGTVYMDNGILKYRGTNGTITVIGNS